MTEFALTFGLTGHRLERLGPTRVDGVEAPIGDLAARVMTAVPENAASAFRVVSALADGADLIGASALLSSGWRLDAMLPFYRDDYRADFADEASLAEFENVLAQAGDVFELASRDDAEPDERAYERAGEVIRAQSDILIAVWDNGPSRGRGGTQEVVSAAVREGLPVTVPTIHHAPSSSVSALVANMSISCSAGSPAHAPYRRMVAKPCWKTSARAT